MLEKMKDIIKTIDADYADLRYEVRKINKVNLSNNQVINAGGNTGDGFVLRVLKNGGFASVIFTKPEDSATAIQKALENALLAARQSDQTVKMATAPVIKDQVKAVLIEDPRQISLEEKVELVQYYSKLVMQVKQISNANLNYQDSTRERYFVNSEGSEIYEELVDTRLTGAIFSQEGSLNQSAFYRSGSLSGFNRIRQRENDLLFHAKIAVDLLKAEMITGGKYDVILNQSLAGTFIHEAFGHKSEADYVMNIQSLKNQMLLNSQLGSELVNVIDDPLMFPQTGSYRYDDEGVAACKVQLMKKGILTGRLHNRITAANLNEPLTGHNMAEDYNFSPIVRMSNTYIEPGTIDFTTMLQMLDNGIYACNSRGGQSGDNFVFTPNYSYLVKNGRIDKMIREISLQGNVINSLKNIIAVGNDFKISETGGCGKMNQLSIRPTSGGPHILINGITVGGQ